MLSSQAMPGPLFNFSSYLGAICAMSAGYVVRALAAHNTVLGNCCACQLLSSTGRAMWQCLQHAGERMRGACCDHVQMHLKSSAQADITCCLQFILGAVIAWFGLFSPGVMIIFGILPYWGRFRKWALYRRALPGLNAAGIGLIITSVFSLTLGAMANSPFPKTSLCLGILAFTAVDQLKWCASLQGTTIVVDARVSGRHVSITFRCQ